MDDGDVGDATDVGDVADVGNVGNVVHTDFPLLERRDVGGQLEFRATGMCKNIS